MTELWEAPLATGAVDAAVDIPGSKSMTNRALVLASLSDAPTTIARPLAARDTYLMAQALSQLGSAIDTTGPDWTLAPGRSAGDAQIDCGLAGTVMRFVPPLAALVSGAVTFDGDPQARERPMGPVVAALRSLGVQVDDAGRGTLPLTVFGTGAVVGGTVEIDASASSQFVSALLLAACRFDEGLTVRHVGEVLPSLPHIKMTVAMLAARGIRVEQPEPTVWRVHPGVPIGGTIMVEADVSNALPFIAAALVSGGRVAIPGFPNGSVFQPDTAVRAVLSTLGATLTDDATGLLVEGSRQGHSGRIRGADLDLRDLGETVPVFAALAALADSPTTISGVAHIRGHETDRLAALAKEINGLGGDVTETADGLVIRPRPLHGGVFETYDDHRLATAAAVLGLAVPGVLVVDVATTAKTLPGFVELWRGLLG